MRAYRETVAENYTYDTFNMPTLSANGTVGGTTYACTVVGSGGTTANSAYYAFNGNTGNYWGFTCTEDDDRTLLFYSPYPIRVTQIEYTAAVSSTDANHAYVTFYRCASTTDYTTTLIGSSSAFVGSTTAVTNTIDCSSTNTEYSQYHSLQTATYYKLWYELDSFKAYQSRIYNVVFYGQTKEGYHVTISGETADFTKDKQKYSVVKDVNTYKAFNQ